MADVTSVLGSISQKFLECPICYGRYQQPKILDCLHTFCQECLVTLQQFSSEHQSRSFIQCPVCDQKSKLPEQGIGKLKTNFHFVGLIEEISVHEQVAQSEQNKKGHICGCCDEEEAVSKCINCIQNLCLKCQIVPQHVAAILAKHTEASLDDLSFGKIAHRFRKQREAAECALHSGEEKKFCETCEELVCQHCPCDCENSESGSTCHLKIDLKSAASDGRKLFREMLAKLQITLSEFKSTLDAVKKKRPECGGYLDGVKKQVQEHASKVHAEVSAEESRLLFQLSKIRRNQQETLIKRGTAIESAIEKMSTTKEVADAFCETSEDQDFLAVFPLIRQALEAHLSRKTSDIHKGLPLWDFRKREGKCEIGTLVKTGMNTFLPHELHDQGGHLADTCSSGKQSSINARQSKVSSRTSVWHLKKKIGRSRSSKANDQTYGYTNTAVSASGFTCSFGGSEPRTCSTTTPSTSNFGFEQLAPSNTATQSPAGVDLKQSVWRTKTTSAASASGIRFGQDSLGFGNVPPATCASGFGFGLSTPTSTSSSYQSFARFDSQQRTTSSTSTASVISFGQSESITSSTTAPSILNFGFGLVIPTNTSTTTQSSAGVDLGQSAWRSKTNPGASASELKFGQAAGVDFEQSVWRTKKTSAASASGIRFGQATLGFGNVPTVTCASEFGSGLSTLTSSATSYQSFAGFGSQQTTSSTNTASALSFGQSEPKTSKTPAPLTVPVNTRTTTQSPPPATSTTFAESSAGFGFQQTTFCSGRSESKTSTTTPSFGKGSDFGISVPANSATTTQSSADLGIGNVTSRSNTRTTTSAFGFAQAASDLGTTTTQASFKPVFSFGQSETTTSTATASFNSPFCFGLAGPAKKKTAAPPSAGLGFGKAASRANTMVTTTTASAFGFSFGKASTSKTSTTVLSSKPVFGCKFEPTASTTTAPSTSDFRFGLSIPPSSTTTIKSSAALGFAMATPRINTSVTLTAASASGFGFGQAASEPNTGTSRVSFKPLFGFKQSQPKVSTTATSCTSNFGFGLSSATTTTLSSTGFGVGQDTSGTSTSSASSSSTSSFSLGAFDGTIPKQLAKGITPAASKSEGFFPKKGDPDSCSPLVFKPFKPEKCSTSTTQTSATGTTSASTGFSCLLAPLSAGITESNPAMDNQAGCDSVQQEEPDAPVLTPTVDSWSSEEHQQVSPEGGVQEKKGPTGDSDTSGDPITCSAEILSNEEGSSSVKK